MKRKRTNRKKWRRGTALFLASLLTLQVFTGNIAGVKALEFTSGEEQAADSGYEVSDYDQSGDTANEENYDVNEENLDAEGAEDAAEEKSGDNSQEEKSGSADSSADDQNGNSLDENESGNTASGSENGNSIAGSENNGSTNGTGTGNTESGSTNGTSDGANTGSTTENGSSSNENTGSTTESSASDNNNPSGDETKASDESTASGAETGASDESTTAGGGTNAADESTSAGSETAVAETGTTAANESSTAETSVPETKPAQQTAYYADDSTVIDMSTAASDLWLYNNDQYGYGDNAPETANGKYVISGSTAKNINIGNGDDSDRYGNNNIEVCLNGLDITGTLTVNPIGELTTDENGENNTSEYEADLTVSVQSKIAKLVLADGAKMNINLADGEAGIEIGEIKLGKGSVLTVTPGNGTVTETEAEAGEELTEEQIQIARAAAKNDGGKFTVTGNFAGEGRVIFTGSENENPNVIVKKGIQADILSFENVSVEANNGAAKGNLEAKSSLTVTESKISGAGLLGYAKTTNGKKTITFDGSNSLTNVSSVGTTADGEAIVTIEGIDTFSALSADVAFYQDYELTYSFENEDKTEGTPGTDWPVYYRTKLTNLTSGQDAKETVIGSHTRSVGSTDAADEAAEDESTEYTYQYAGAGSNGVTLPVFSVTGYQYAGWTLSDADEEDSEAEPVKALSGEHSGALTLTLALKSDPVKVTFDRNYDPDENTNDDYKTLSRTETYDKELGDIIELGEQPYRFGYKFEGWKVTTGKKITELPADATTYTVALDDTETTDTESTSLLSGLIRMLEGEAANQRIVNFEAVWSPKEYDLRLFMNSSVAPENIQVIDGGTAYTLEKYAEKYPNVNYTSGETQISFVPKIEYGESLEHYLTEKVGISSLPVLEDTRTGELKVDFNGWQTPGNNMIGDISKLTFAVGSILDNINRANNQTLKDYDQVITTTPPVLTTQWGTASYTLTTDIVSGWEIFVDNVKQSPSVFTKMRNALTKSNTMSIKVKTGSTVSWRCSATSPENFSLWNFSTDPKEIVFAPEETDYSSSAQYLYFNATMPAANVTAVNSSDLSNLYIDISQSPITFEENVTLKSGRTTNGFWYGLPMEGTEYKASDNTTLNVNAMSPLFQAESSDSTHPGEYFYEWRFKDSFRITSQKNSTTNPLTVVNAIKLYMKDCRLAANQEYKDEVQGRKVGSDVVEAASVTKIIQDKIKSFKKYGNIIQDVSGHAKYNVDITALGYENSLGVIVQSAFFAASGYESTFYIKGQSRETTKAVLSGIFANATLSFSNITIEEDEKSKSEYLVFVNGADEHQCHVYFTNCDVNAPNKRLYTLEGSSVLRSTHMDIGSARTYGTTTLYNDSYLHCRKDWLGRYATFTINDDSSVVVEGNVLSGYPHRTAGATISTSGYYIVKGNRADLENFNLTEGTVIVNAALIARSCTITGGTLITNQIMNSPAKYPYYVDSNGEYTYTNMGYVVSADKNGDDYPFLTYAAIEPTAGVYEFSGNASIGILGYYQASGNSYDTTVTGMDPGNPVADFIDAVVDENGNIRSSVSLPNLENAVKNSSYKTNECFVLGNSEYDTAATMRSVKISGNAKFYAAGNVTFYNDTTITGGEIYCGGTLASKRDLSIGSAANITAKEVGNNYNLCEKDDNGFKRWEKTEITGGTIKADRIGSLTTAHGNKSGDEYSRTTLKISGSPNITRLSESTSGAKTEYVTDTRINYVYEDPLDNPETNPDNVRHMGENFENLTADSVTTIENPSSTDSSVSARWALDALSGPYMNQIMTNAALAYDSKEIEGAHAYKDRDYILLYAVQDNYNINVKAGAEQIESITANGTTYKEFSTPIVSGHGSDVEVILNGTEMKDKTVIWYIDAAGQIHNVKPEIKAASGKTEISFKMPIGNADIYVTDEMTLYLNKTEITLTQDGFRTKYDMDGADTDDFSFKYLGGIVVTQDNISETVLKSTGYVYAVDNNGVYKDWAYCATTNRLHIVGWYSDRNVTLEKVLMDGGLDEDKIFIEENCDVTLKINGAVRLLSTKLAGRSKLTFAGKNNVKAGESNQDAIHFYAGAAGSKFSTGFINNGTEKTGDVTFSSINIVRTYPNVGDASRRPIVYSSSSKRGGNVLFDNCTIKMTIYDSMGIVRYYENVSLKDCDAQLSAIDSYPSVLFENCSNVKIDGGKFDALFSSPYRTYAPYNSTGTFEITNHANVTWREKESRSDMVFLSDTGNDVIPATFTVKNGAVFSMDHRMKLKTLRLTADPGSDAPTVTVGQKNGDTYDGYLLCKNLEVEKGTLNTGGLLISGYYDAPSRGQDYKSEAEIMEMLKTETKITSGGVMNITGGEVNASEFVGGAREGSINVSGGKLTSPAIGTLDKLYGYGQNIPEKGGKWIYSYATIPKTLTVTLSDGGAIEVQGGQNGAEGYLGGMNSVVNMTGGTLTIDDNAVVGMSESHKKTLSDYYSSKGDSILAHKPNCSVSVSGGYVKKNSDNGTGSISAPYGEVTISGAATKVDVNNLQAERGDVTITQASGKTDGFDNPYRGGEPLRQEKVGVKVSGLLTAENLTIKENAQVFADKAYAVVTDGKGILSVPKGSGAGLYSNAYGELGISRADDKKDYIDRSNSEDQTVFGSHMVSITYVLNPKNVIFSDDVQKIKNPNPENYMVKQGSIELQDAECSGYYFRGWYIDPELQIQADAAIDTSLSSDLTLYAKWEKIKVKFAVRIPVGDEITKTALPGSEFDGITGWKRDGDYYISEITPSIEYGSKILGTSGVNVGLYSTKTMNVLEVEIADTGNYTGVKKIDGATIVTADLAEAYRSISNGGENTEAVIVLTMVDNQKRRAVITFALNKKDNKPSDAAFAGVTTQAMEDTLGIDESLAKSTKFADANVTDADSKSPGLIQPSATGYTFIGWNTDKDADENASEGWVTSENVFKTETTVYAVWKPNTYLVRFIGGGESNRVWVTEGNSEPQADLPKVPSLLYYWVYDTPVSAGSFYPVKDGEENLTGAAELPYAWKEGYVFNHTSGWTLADGSKKSVGRDTVLNKSVITTLDPALGDPNGKPKTVALTLEASYSSVKVRYHLEGGKFKETVDGSVMDTVENPIQTAAPTFGTPLKGYTKMATVPDGGMSTANVSATDEKGTMAVYQVISTTADHYNSEKEYVADDYRHVLSKKGYTFGGWFTRVTGTSESGEPTVQEGTQIGSTPRFQDVDVYAKWTPNSYKLDLYNKGEGEYQYTEFDTDKLKSPIKQVPVTVGSEINVTDGVQWPSRNGDWYAYNKGTDAQENAKRFFLGVTFAALDPGDTRDGNAGYQTYINYAKSVTKLQNSGTLFQNRTTQSTPPVAGTIFQLPEDTTYQSAISDSYGSTAAEYKVPDYPDGSTISMYAIYRERSLVFVERYIDENGDVQETVMSSGPWNEYSTYPKDYTPSQAIKNLGYSLVGWYVNGTTTAAPKYPDNKAAYDTAVEGYKSTAVTTGTYDIIVYTVYAPQITQNVYLNASTSSKAGQQVAANVYTLPASMELGELRVKLQSEVKDLKLVSAEEMKKHVYDSTWKDNNNVSHTADDTVAIVATLETGSSRSEIDLSAVTTENSSFKLNAGAGSKITLTMYHSGVMTGEKDYEIKLELSFYQSASDGSNRLEYQWIKENVHVKLVQSLYDVTYTVQLPESADKLTPVGQKWNAFDEPENASAMTTAKTETVGYGADLTDALPEFEGYTATKTQWFTTADSANGYTTLTMPVTAENDGKISLVRGYKPNWYKLSADSDVLQWWNITYTDGAAGNASEALSADKADVKYHSVVTFSPKANADGKTDPPQFVTLTMTGADGTVEKVVKLPDYGTAAADGKSYTFAMPAYAVHASRVTVQTLYLDDGTISITAEGYTHEKKTGTVTATWPGDYVILQCADNNAHPHSTANVLNLEGELGERTIQLGNLDITSQDSIALAEGTKANLTVNYDGKASWIKAKNILTAGSGTELKIHTGLMSGTAEDPNQKAEITLAPSTSRAAIGGSTGTPEIGTIEVDNLNLNLNLPAGSAVSGIGAGSKTGNKGGTVSVTNSVVGVAEDSATSGYSGAWIGGTIVSEVTVDNTEIKKTGTKNMGGPVITDGEKVTIKDSTIGSKDTRVNDPVHAASELTIVNSKIYQEILDDLTMTDATAPIGTANGTTTVSKESQINTQYAGSGNKSDYYTGKLLIEDAESDVYIWGTQIVELGNGSVEIEAQKVTQGEAPNKVSHDQSGNMNYLLLEEKGTAGSDSDVTIESLGSGRKVTVRNPYGKNATSGEVTVKDLSVNADAEIVLEGNLTVTEKAALGSEKKLKVDANAVDNTADQNPYGITLKDASTGTNAAFADGASYTQEGGKLTSVGDLGNKEGSGLDVTLTNVTTNVSNLYAKDLTISGGSAEAGTNGTTGEIGSKPALDADGTAAPTTVTLTDGASVAAKTIGALGVKNKTFTFVEAETKGTTKLDIHGDVVQDLYRLKYDTVTDALDVSKLDTVVRVKAENFNNDAADAKKILGKSTTICPPDGVPEKPGFGKGDVDSVFTCWYIWQEKAGSADAERIGLAVSGSAKPEGMTDITTLTNATPDTVKSGEYYPTVKEDGTSTLLVHAWLKATGTATVKKDRLFESFNDGTEKVEICENHAFTAQLVSTGTAISGRDYALTFSSALPVGTDLTLTLADDPKSYYYYTVTETDAANGKKDFFFSEFKAMGSESAPVFTADTSAADETFLVAVDFADVKASNMAVVKTSDLTMQFKLAPSKADKDSTLELGNPLTCSFAEVQQGLLKAGEKSVQVTQAPTGDSALDGRTLYLAAKVTKQNSTSGSADSLIPYGVKATLSFAGKANPTNGTWISRDTVLFEAGTYNTDGNGVSTAERTVTFEGLDAGSYDVQWTLVYGAGSGNDLYNLLGNTLSNSAKGTYTVAAKADPYLAVTADEAGRTIAQGIEKTVGFNWKSTAEAADVKVTVEKQGLLGDFEEVSGSVAAEFVINQPKSSATDGQMTTGTAAVTFTNNVSAGTYRIVFSMDKDSREDNVYFVFIVEDNK